MRETTNISAIILNRCAFKECDTRVTLYSPEMGKLELVARGTKKLKSKLAGHLEPITLSEIMIVPGKQFDYIGTADSSDSFINIKNDLDKLVLAGKAIGIFNSLVKEGEKDGGIFRLLLDFFNFLNKKDLRIKHPEFFYNFFIYKLLSGLGYGLDCHDCSLCGTEIIDGGIFDYEKGGISCKKCADKTRINNSIAVSAESIRIFVMASEENFDCLIGFEADKKHLDGYNKAVKAFFEYNF